MHLDVIHQIHVNKISSLLLSNRNQISQIFALKAHNMATNLYWYMLNNCNNNCQEKLVCHNNMYDFHTNLLMKLCRYGFGTYSNDNLLTHNDTGVEVLTELRNWTGEKNTFIYVLIDQEGKY